MILGADHPYNHVTGAISRGGKRRAATAGTPVYIPTAGDRRRIGRSNAQSGQNGVTFVVRANRNKGALFRSIGDGCLNDRAAGNHRFCYGGTDSAEVVSIKQIHFEVLTQGDHEMRRRRTGHVHQQWARAAQIEVETVQSEPIFRHPVIGGRATKDWAGLEANYCFSTFPNWGIEGVTSGNKRVLPIASNTADSPYGTAVRVGGSSPCCYAGRIVYRHAYEPAMKEAAISHTTIANVKNVAHD